MFLRENVVLGMFFLGEFCLGLYVNVVVCEFRINELIILQILKEKEESCIYCMIGKLGFFMMIGKFEFLFEIFGFINKRI